MTASDVWLAADKCSKSRSTLRRAAAARQCQTLTCQQSCIPPSSQLRHCAPSRSGPPWGRRRGATCPPHPGRRRRRRWRTDCAGAEAAQLLRVSRTHVSRLCRSIKQMTAYHEVGAAAGGDRRDPAGSVAAGVRCRRRRCRGVRVADDRDRLLLHLAPQRQAAV